MKMKTLESKKMSVYAIMDKFDFPQSFIDDFSKWCQEHREKDMSTRAEGVVSGEVVNYMENTIMKIFDKKESK